MFTVLILYCDGSERLVPSDGEISYDDAVLTIGSEEFPLDQGDAAFVMNRDGNTVRKYRVK